MRFYAACLAAYNNGRLHGHWIDASSDIEEMQKAIAKMLKESPIPGAEEWAIHDYEDMADLGEYPSLRRIAALAEFDEDHPEIPTGDLWRIVDHFCGDIEQAEDALDDRFVGIYESFRAYAEEHADEIILSNIKDETVKRYFDYDAFARDLRMDHEVIETSEGVAIFHH